MKKFWNWKSVQDSDNRILELNGTIAEESWLDDDITPEEFRSELERGRGNITVLINSPGGDCVAASRIYAMLKDYDGEVTVRIDGLAASAASVIAMAGDTVQMAPAALMMIHNPSTVAWGDHVDMERAVGMLNEVKESIINAYELRTGLSRTVLSHMMDDETWMNAKKAVEMGFADEMLGESEDEAYVFAVSSVARNFTNKISAKARKKDSSAKVSDLMAKMIEKMLKY
jgi:ATP-dependent Clp protease protease subunit